ncbi:DNA excision repair protein ERCC-1 isoform 2-T2 [Pholidichthys leucotaenia]
MKKRFNINLDDSVFTKERPPPKPHFQPSSKGGQDISASTATPVKPVEQPLSYAQYVVQNSVTGAPQRDPASKHLKTDDGAGLSPLGQSEPVSSSTVRCESDQNSDKGTEGANSETKPAGVTDKKEDSTQKSEPSISVGPKPVGSGSSIIVSLRQRGNPILKFVRSVPWEFGEVVPDYVLGQTTCALFLSLRYHNLNPNYIHDRLKQLGRAFTLRVLLVQVDVKDPHHALKELARICIMADFTLILAWRNTEKATITATTTPVSTANHRAFCCWWLKWCPVICCWDRGHSHHNCCPPPSSDSTKK